MTTITRDRMIDILRGNGGSVAEARAVAAIIRSDADSKTKSIALQSAPVLMHRCPPWVAHDLVRSILPLLTFGPGRNMADVATDAVSNIFGLVAIAEIYESPWGKSAVSIIASRALSSAIPQFEAVGIRASAHVAGPTRPSDYILQRHRRGGFRQQAKVQSKIYAEIYGLPKDERISVWGKWKQRHPIITLRDVGWVECLPDGQ